MSTRSRFITTACLVFALGGTSCQDAETPNPQTPPQSAAKTTYTVVTTCGMVTDIVTNVMGTHGEVRGLMGEGVDPHMYKPTRNDQAAVLKADIVFYSGLLLEGRMADTFARVAKQGKPVHAVADRLDKALLREPPEFSGHPDPHVWMDISMWSQCVGFVADALSEFDPSHADSYRANAEAYQSRLAAMDKYVKQTIHTIPDSQRWLVTAHDAFGYFSLAYGIQVKSIQGITTDSTPAVKDINDLVDFLVTNKIDAVFVESSVNQKNMRSIIEGCREKNWTVKIGGKLYSDAMGTPGTYSGTYLGMMDHNATIIARALGGQAPETGKDGKLSPGK